MKLTTRVLEMTRVAYAVSMRSAEYLKPEAKFPSLILPMKKPESQLWNMMPASII